MASNNSLQKLLVNVPSASCDAFIKKYINSDWAGTADTVANTVVLPTVDARVSEGDGQNNQYDDKVVFLSKYHAIYTQGALFGYDGDFHNILTDLIEEHEEVKNDAGEVISPAYTGIKVETNAVNGIKLTLSLYYDEAKKDLVLSPILSVTTATYSTTNKAWTNASNVVTGETVQTYVDDVVKTAVDAAAVTAMEYKGGLKQAGFNAFANATDKKLLDGNVYVAEEEITVKPATETEKAVIAEIGDTIIVHYDQTTTTLDYVVIERNVDDTVTAGSPFEEGKVLISGANQTAYTTGYTTGGATFATTGDSSYILATEAAVAAYVGGVIGALDAGITYNANVNNYVSYTYTQTDGLVSDVTVGLKIAEYTYTPATESELSKFTYKNEADSYGLIDHVILNNYISYVGDQITDIQNYIDDINETFTTVSTESDYVSISYSKVNHEGIENGDLNDYAYTINVVTKTLGDAVGMYVGEDGKWHAANGDVTTDGLATAADVAKEIVENEKVIAAALNDHEARLDALENDIDNLGDTITSSFEALDGTASAHDANSYVSVTINEVDGKLTDEGSSLTVQYGAVNADLQVTANGLIDATQLANVLNNINLWETFTPQA